MMHPLFAVLAACTAVVDVAPASAQTAPTQLDRIEQKLDTILHRLDQIEPGQAAGKPPSPPAATTSIPSAPETLAGGALAIIHAAPRAELGPHRAVYVDIPHGAILMDAGGDTGDVIQLRAIFAAPYLPPNMPGHTLFIAIMTKLAPYFSAVGHLVHQLDEAGADGCVLFNRFYQPDIDLASLALRRDLELSTRAEIRLPLLWVGILAGKVRGSLAAASGVETADEVVKFLLAGADTVMTTSALMRYGSGHMRNNLLNGLTDWLDARKVAGVGDIRGKLSHSSVTDPTAFERANYISILQGWSAENRP